MVIICVLIVLQGLTGTLLAAISAMAQPQSPDRLRQTVQWCASLRSAHAFLGQAALVPAFTLLTLAILFMFNVGSFDTRHTRFTWSQVMRALLLCAILFGIALRSLVIGSNVSVLTSVPRLRADAGANVGRQGR